MSSNDGKMICFRADQAFDSEVDNYCKKYGISKASFFRMAGYDKMKGPPLPDGDMERLDRVIEGFESLKSRFDLLEKQLLARTTGASENRSHKKDIDHYKQALLARKPASMKLALELLLELFPSERDSILAERLHARAIAELGPVIVRITSTIKGTLEWMI